MEPWSGKLRSFFRKELEEGYSKCNWLLVMVSGKDDAFFQAAVNSW